MTTNVVIGAGSGMGEAVAKQLAREPRRLVLADLNLDAAQRVADGLEGDIEVVRCDIGVRADIEALAATVGSLGRLVLTAGLSPTMAPGRRIHEINLIAPTVLLEVFLPLAGPGSVCVLFSSMAGHAVPAVEPLDAIIDHPLSPAYFDDLAALGVDADEPGGAYGISKRGLMRLVQRECLTWGKRGARLVTISPGIVDTPMGRQEKAQQPVMAGLVANSALGRELSADELANVAVFAASDAASALTGTDILVDGGAVPGMAAMMAQLAE